ncbi:MAG: outer membrane protein transport protein [Rudaea sp.]|uniref:OmpP1/FadL family transporter n=1 Tax=Rudaea sp. TaxID=2136325 RepID=UPI0039E22631
MIKIKQHPRIVPALTALIFAIAAAVVSQGAYASAFQLTENSAQGLGRAQAGGPAAPGDCSAVVNNPAAMSDFKTDCLAGIVSAINFSAKFYGGGEDAFGQPLTGGNGGDGGDTIPVPSAYFIHPVTERLVLGIGLSAPFGFQTEYDDRWVGRYQGVKTKLQSPALTFAASLKLSDELSVGMSVFAQRTSATLVQDIDLGTVLAQYGVLCGETNFPAQQCDGQGGLKGHNLSYGAGFGVLWKPTPDDRIGFNYRSNVDHDIKGQGTFLIPSNLLPYLGGAFVATGGHADINTPWYASLGWWHTFNDRFSAGINVAYTNWSSFKGLTIVYDNPVQPTTYQDFSYKDTWFTSIGADYKLDDRWTLRGGLAYDQTPTSDATRDPKVPDNSRLWVSIGAGYQFSDNLRIDAAFVHLFVNDAKVNDTSLFESTLTGAFKVTGNVLSVGGQYTF